MPLHVVVDNGGGGGTCSNWCCVLLLNGTQKSLQERQFRILVRCQWTKINNVLRKCLPAVCVVLVHVELSGAGTCYGLYFGSQGIGPGHYSWEPKTHPELLASCLLRMIRLSACKGWVTACLGVGALEITAVFFSTSGIARSCTRTHGVHL